MPEDITTNARSAYELMRSDFLRRVAARRDATPTIRNQSTDQTIAALGLRFGGPQAEERFADEIARARSTVTAKYGEIYGGPSVQVLRDTLYTLVDD